MREELNKFREEEIIQSVLDTVNDGVTVIDRDLKVVYHNESIRKKFGDITGRYCYEAYRKREEPCVNCQILDVLKDGKQRKVLYDTTTPSGDIRWMECSSGALIDKGNEIIGAVEIVRDVTDQMRLTKECATLKREMQRAACFENIITQSKKMKTIFNLVEKIAPARSTVLITGESGTGKELIARAIHNNSDREQKPFVSVNCAAIPENLLESELFGHVKGAFTGAVKNHTGLIAAAEGGTLFLDEIGEIPLKLQGKLLRFLQEGTCRRVGDTAQVKFNVRVVCATNRDLEEAVRDNLFREDLFFRLNVIPVFLPPLRERREDIPLLANHFLQKLCDTHNKKISGIESTALKKLMDYSWPGNIRELENCIEYSLHLADGDANIGVSHLPARILSKEENSDNFKISTIEDYIKKSILKLQKEYNEEQIAETLGISRKNLWEKRKKWDITKPFSGK